MLHLPVRGVGDGGIYTTAADVRAFWAAFFAGRIVSREWVAEMIRPRSDALEELAVRPRLLAAALDEHASILEGYDAGVSFRSLHDPDRDLTCTVISNWSDGAWPVLHSLEEKLGLS